MHIDIHTKNITLDNSLEVFVNQKVGALEKLLKNLEPYEARIEIGKPSGHHKKGIVFYAEANLKVRGGLLRAQCEHSDLRSAIIKIKDELQIQVKKYKERQASK